MHLASASASLTQFFLHLASASASASLDADADARCIKKCIQNSDLTIISNFQSGANVIMSKKNKQKGFFNLNDFFFDFIDFTLDLIFGLRLRL